MKLKSFLVGVCLIAASSSAARAEGWYVGGFVTPYTDADDIEFGTALGTVTTTFDGDMGLGFVVGRELGSWRVEGEWSLRDFDVEDFSGEGLAVDLVQGRLHFNADGAAVEAADSGVDGFDLGGHAGGELLEFEGELEGADNGVESGEAIGIAPAGFEVLSEGR